MRIGFVGKGGSGKTTLSCLFASYIASQGMPTLVFDADVNMHVGLGLGFSPDMIQKARHVGVYGDDIKEYVRGENKRIKKGELIKTTPPGEGSRFIRITSHDALLNTYAISQNNLYVMLAGTYNEGDVGTTCFHKYAGVVEIILNHLLDTPNDVAVIDMTAGIDAFSTGLFAAIEQTYLVVEPTLRSVGVFQQYAKHAAREGIQVFAVGNKVRNTEDYTFLKKHLGASSLITILPFSHHVQAFERGEVTALSYESLQQDAQEALQTIYRHAQTYVRDSHTFYKKMIELHAKNCAAWANKHFGHDLMEQVDPLFSYPKV